MKPLEIFNLVLRILGLFFLYQGLATLPMAIAQLMSAISSKNLPQALFTFIMVGWPVLIAWWLLRGAPLLVRIAYPETKSTSSDIQTTPNPTASKTDL